MASNPGKPSARIRHFVASLSEQERMLVILKRELYEGSWDAMLADLKARLDGKPFIFKLAHRIEDDIERIERIQEFELENDADMGDYIKLPDPSQRRR